MRFFTKKPCYHQGFFAVKRREVFILGAKWIALVRGWRRNWRHGNSFPMAQNAQSHRQMRSIPHCHKAVFYVFVFDSIHEPATMPNLFPEIFYQWKNLQCFLKWILEVATMRAMVRMALMSASNGNSPACGTPIFSMASAPTTFCSVR